MKHTPLLIISLFVINSGHCQINHINSFIETNQNASLELFGTDDLFIPKNGKFIYAFSDTSILKYKIDSNTGEAISVEIFNDELYGINSTNFCSRSIAHTTDDKFLYIAGNCYNAFSIFKVDSNTGNCLFVDTVIDNKNGIKGINAPISLAISTDNKYLYVASADNLITILVIDKSTGNVNYIDSDSLSSIDGINLIKVTPDNQYIYAVSSSNSSLLIFKRDINTGLLTFYKKLEKDADNELLFNGINDIAFDSTGLVYITAQRDSSLVIFKINEDYGELTEYKKFKEGIDGVSGLDNPIAVESGPDQKLIYVVSNNFFVKTAITAFKWDRNKDLNFAGSNIYTSLTDPGMIYNPSNLKISPNSKFLYVSELRNSICEFYKLGAFLNLGDDKDICEGDTAVILPDNSYKSYQWNNSSEDSSLFVTSNSSISLEVIDEFGKIGRDTVNVTFHEYPLIELGEDTTVYFGDTLKLSVNEGLDGYLWNTGETTNQLFFIADSIEKDTLFSVAAYNEFGCSSADTIGITILAPSSVSDIKNFNIEVYPNPFNNVLYIKGVDLNNFETIEIVDISGKLVYKKNINHNIQYEKINMPDLAPGLYYLGIYNKNECVNRKLIKK